MAGKHAPTSPADAATEVITTALIERAALLAWLFRGFLTEGHEPPATLVLEMGTVLEMVGSMLHPAPPPMEGP